MDSSPPSLVVTGSLFRRRSVAALRWSTMTVTAFGEPRPHATLHVELLDPPVTGLEPETLTLTLARELEERSRLVGWSDFAALLVRKDSAALLVFDPPEQGGVRWKDRPFGEAMRFLESNLEAVEAALASPEVPFAARLRLHQAFFSFLLTGRAVVCNRKLLLQKGVVGLARPTARFLKVLRRVEGAVSRFASTTAEHFDRPLPEGSFPGASPRDLPAPQPQLQLLRGGERELGGLPRPTGRRRRRHPTRPQPGRGHAEQSVQPAPLLRFQPQAPREGLRGRTRASGTGGAAPADRPSRRHGGTGRRRGSRRGRRSLRPCPSPSEGLRSSSRP